MQTSTNGPALSQGPAAAGAGPRAPGARLGRVWTVVGVLSLLVAAVADVVVATRLGHHGSNLLDERVYLAAGRRMLQGTSIYGFSIGPWPFTYPPFAALVLKPLSLLPTTAAMYVWFAISIMALGVSCWVVAGSLSELALSAKWPRRWVTAAVMFGTGSILEPVLKNSSLGQISAVLMMLVVVDVLVPWRFRGMLIGLAAGIKIVPAVFILLLLVTRQRRAALWAIGTAAATVAIGALAAPGDSWLFWTRLLYDTHRVGNVMALLNGSLLGALSQLIGNAAVTTALWLACALAILIAGLTACRALWRLSAVTAMVTTALAGLLIMPISWDHYFVWLVPVAGVLAALAVRAWTLRFRVLSAAAAAAAVAVVVVGVVGPDGLVRVHRLPGSRLAASIAYASLALLSFAVLVAAAYWRARLWPAPAEDQAPDGDHAPQAR